MMMKLISFFCLIAVPATAFTAPNQGISRLQSRPATAQCSMSSSMSDGASSSNASGSNMLDEHAMLRKEWMAQLESDEVAREVRREMLAKYIALGKTMEEAEREVDIFLSDPEQSLQFLEMRRYAKSQELVGPELFMQLGGAFALGVGATILSKYIGI